MPQRPEDIIGYSGFVLDEECYGYNEDACFIAGARALAAEFMNDSSYCPGEYRIDPVSLKDMIEDYGCSCGEFAMDMQAFTRFAEVAKSNDLEHKAKDWYMDSSLRIVNILQRGKA